MQPSSQNMAPAAYFIPPELVETIIAFVSYRPTLKACSLAGPAFTLPAQRGLFAEVFLSPPKSRSQKRSPANRFLNLITSSPHLASFVHSLVIECEDSVQGQPWLYSDNDLQHVFPRLSKLTKISVNGRIQPDDEGMSGKANLSWTSLSASLRTALISLIRSGSVVDLELGGFSRIPVSSVVDSCSRLKKLSLLPLYLVDDTPLPDAESSENPSENRVHLEDIKIKQSAVALRRTADWLLSPTCHLDVGELKRLHFEVSTLDDHRQISKIVNTCSKSLEHLEVNPGSEVNSVRHLLRSVPVERNGSPALSLETLQALKSLKVNTKINMFKMNNNRFSDPLPWIVSLLSTIPEENDLTELDLSFALQLTQPTFERVAWQDLVSALSSKKFNDLQRVTLAFPPSTKDSVSQERLFWVQDTLNRDSHLSPLITHGLLHVDI
ncbi:hypothetical protein DFP72DRAFT_972381 [Ephemerocybe angulata]|uniref:Uncharacterized protein n=1 Tax=Ephemerocybe angulata TaxID=980116 RepID=A0A8H6M0S8_9AGAR|nr:hypothetical protein DFP72DRAFT_972381 [Tulosesus angulatus]